MMSIILSDYRAVGLEVGPHQAKMVKFDNINVYNFSTHAGVYFRK